MAQVDEAVTLMGPYDTVSQTRYFKGPFWITMEMNGTVLMETEDADGFTVRYVPRKELEKAVQKCQVVRAGW